MNCVGYIGIFMVELATVTFPNCPGKTLVTCRSGDSLLINSNPMPDAIFYGSVLITYVGIQIYYMRTLKNSFYMKYQSHKKMIIS
jgi:hypothetical protein